jgi:predicted dehydrogenase
MKIGIVGSGSIVPDFLNACTLIPQIEVTSILGTERSVNRMESLATQYGIDSIYTQYEDFLKSDRVEVVYIALPNHLHFTFAKEALLSGKHVIVEKPFTTSYKEAQELYVLATQRQLFLFEAISNQYFPNYHKVKELLPQLGTLKIVQLNYSQYSRRYDSFKAGNI